MGASLDQKLLENYVMTKPTRLKTCKVCKQKFMPERQLQCTCGYDCAILHVKTLQQSKKRKAIKQFKSTDIATMKNKAQDVVNEYIRLRDGKICISCGFVGDGRKWDAGHYLPRGRNSLLRYHEDNIHAQCVQCNRYKSGNLVEYRANLINKIGLEKVEWLESNRGTKKWKIEELQEIVDKYKGIK